MFSLPGETILYGSAESGLVVTTHRLRSESKSWGQVHTIGIMLEELCSAELRYSSHPWFLVFAGLCVLFGGIGTLLAYTIGDNILTILKFVPACIGGIFAIGAVLFYFITRNMILILSSAGASIVLDASSQGVEAAQQLIDIIEAAKNYRLLGISGTNAGVE